MQRTRASFFRLTCLLIRNRIETRLISALNLSRDAAMNYSMTIAMTVAIAGDRLTFPDVGFSAVR